MPTLGRCARVKLCKAGRAAAHPGTPLLDRHLVSFDQLGELVGLELDLLGLLLATVADRLGADLLQPAARVRACVDFVAQALNQQSAGKP